MLDLGERELYKLNPQGASSSDTMNTSNMMSRLASLAILATANSSRQSAADDNPSQLMFSQQHIMFSKQLTQALGGATTISLGKDSSASSEVQQSLMEMLTGRHIVTAKVRECSWGVG